MNYVKKFNLFGVEARQRPTLTGRGTPVNGESGTQGTEGELYMDLDTGKVYKCVGAPNIWVSATKEVDDQMGDVSAALDSILEIQNELIGGGSV